MGNLAVSFGWVAAEVSYWLIDTAEFFSSPCVVAASGAVRAGCSSFLAWLPTRWQSPLVHHSCACQAAGLTAAGSELAKLCSWRDQEPGGWKGNTCCRESPNGLRPPALSPHGFSVETPLNSYIFPSNISDETEMTPEREWDFSPRLTMHVFAVGTILPNKAPQVETEEGISAYTSCQIGPS